MVDDQKRAYLENDIERLKEYLKGHKLQEELDVPAQSFIKSASCRDHRDESLILFNIPFPPLKIAKYSGSNIFCLASHTDGERFIPLTMPHLFAAGQMIWCHFYEPDRSCENLISAFIDQPDAYFHPIKIHNFWGDLLGIDTINGKKKHTINEKYLCIRSLYDEFEKLSVEEVCQYVDEMIEQVNDHITLDYIQNPPPDIARGHLIYEFT